MPHILDYLADRILLCDGAMGTQMQARTLHVERVDHGRRGGDVGADQQRAGGLDGDLDEDRDIGLGLGAGVLGAVDRGLDLQRVLAGLDQDGIDAAGDQAAALHGERVLELLILDMAERRQPRARPDRADDEASAPVAFERVDRLARQLAGPPVERRRLVRYSELAQRDRRAAEAVGLHRVGAGAQISQMNLADQVGPALAQNLGAVLVAQIVALDVERARLHLRPHGAVA